MSLYELGRVKKPMVSETKKKSKSSHKSLFILFCTFYLFARERPKKAQKFRNFYSNFLIIAL